MPEPQQLLAQSTRVQLTNADWACGLFEFGEMTPQKLEQESTLAKNSGQTLREHLSLHHGLSDYSISKACAEHYNAQRVDVKRDPPQAELIAHWGAEQCLKDSILPWKTVGRWTIILAADLEKFIVLKSQLEMRFGDVRVALIAPEELKDVACDFFSPELIANAERKTRSDLSCRNMRPVLFRVVSMSLIVLLCWGLFFQTGGTVLALTFIAFIAMLLQTLLKCGGLYHAFFSPDDPLRPQDHVTLPVITIMVPLFKENAIAARLVKQLGALNYPREKLDICLVTEEEDAQTRASLKDVNLPKWMRVVIVPHGVLQTKPRALNYALTFARGAIVGIYDAEDSPDADQVLKVAQRFANCDPKVVCLQGILDYYNSGRNLMTRCFTAEYAGWFRVLLPGVAKMGFVVPLGGTTLFFRKDVLEELGAWDAHNVTEDADLGVRLTRFGYRTELIQTTTKEEANGRAWSWVKQRSRWLKGYAMTYGVHMRDPIQLYKDLGAWRFWGFQVQFLGALISILLAPLLLSFWILVFGISHPIESYMNETLMVTMLGLCVFSELTNFIVGAVGLIRAQKDYVIKYLPLMIPYNMMAVAALYKGLAELAWKPFYWDKTDHGVLLPEDSQ